MNIKATLAVIALALSPTLALAEGGCHNEKAKEITASSCMVGTTWDETKGTCVANPTS
jgi:hypothetical protein